MWTRIEGDVYKATIEKLTVFERIIVSILCMLFVPVYMFLTILGALILPIKIIIYIVRGFIKHDEPRLTIIKDGFVGISIGYLEATYDLWVIFTFIKIYVMGIKGEVPIDYYDSAKTRDRVDMDRDFLLTRWEYYHNN